MIIVETVTLLAIVVLFSFIAWRHYRLCGIALGSAYLWFVLWQTTGGLRFALAAFFVLPLGAMELLDWRDGVRETRGRISS